MSEFPIIFKTKDRQTVGATSGSRYFTKIRTAPLTTAHRPPCMASPLTTAHQRSSPLTTSYPGAFSMRLDYTRLRVGIGEKLEKALEKAAHVATKYSKICGVFCHVMYSGESYTGGSNPSKFVNYFVKRRIIKYEKNCS